MVSQVTWDQITVPNTIGNTLPTHLVPLLHRSPAQMPTSTLGMALPTLPQELIDKIIDQFGGTARSDNDHTPNKRMLATLSTVAKAWKERSQKHLFSVIDFRGYPTTQIVESDFGELNLVFSLTKDLEIDGNWEVYSQFDRLAMLSLRCFRNLETLTLSGWYFKWHNAKQLKNCFGHLGETLIHLKVEGTASSEALIYLTSMLPRLIVLEISITAVSGVVRTISREELPTTGSFQGYLHLWGLSEAHNDFLIFISSTSPRFATICIDDCDTGGGTGELVKSSAASLESLELYVDSGNVAGELPGP